MRKLLVLVFVAVFVAMMCVPSYGSILVYKTTQTSTVLDTTTPSLGKVTEKGYLVLDVDLTNQDVNSAQQITFTGKSGPTLKALSADVVFHKEVTGNIVADYSSGNTNAVLFGKTSDGKAAGLAGDQVAKSLKGYTVDFTTPFFSSGTMTATLDAKTTKANSTTPIDTLVLNLIANQSKFQLVVDNTPPTPSPMTFAVGGEPTAISNSQIIMTATEATDATTPPVLYYFTNKTVSGHDSGWVSERTYTDSVLDANTLYTYTVMAEDSVAPTPNPTLPSADANATTFAVASTTTPDPNPPFFDTPPTAVSDTSITMTAHTETGALGTHILYYFRNKILAHHDSGWQSGTTYTDVGLVPDTNYGYTIQAHDNALVPNYTAESNEVNAVTGLDTVAPDPNPATFVIAPHATSTTTIAMQATIATDSSNPVQYQFRRTNPDSTVAVSAWQTDSNFIATGLSENTTYSFQVRTEDSAVNAASVITPNVGAFSTAASATTLTSLKSQMNAQIFASGLRSATTPPNQPLVVTIADGNYGEDVDINEPNITLQSANGSAATIIQLQAGATGIATTEGCKVGGSTGHGFTILGGTGTTNLLLLDDNRTEVSYCDINSVGALGAAAAVGVSVGTADVVAITGNNFGTGAADSAIKIVGAPSKDVTISNNTCASIATADFVWFASADVCAVAITGNTTDAGIDVGVGNTGTKVKNLTISSNTFTGKGIQLVEGTVSAEPNRLMTTTISGNTFSAGSNAYALLIPATPVLPATGSALEPNDVNWATLTFTQNIILRPAGGPTFTVDNQIGAPPADANSATTILIAQHNYWDGGTPSLGPTNGCPGGIGASITTPNTYILYLPFWTTPTGTDANCP